MTNDLARVTLIAAECGLAVSSDGKDFLCNYKQLLSFEQAVLAKRDDHYWDAESAAKEMDKLQAKLAMLTRERDDYKSAKECLEKLDHHKMEVFESLQAKIAMQAEAIDSAAPVYTSARNSSAVRKGFEVSGSVMHYIIQPYKLHTALNATQADVDAFMAKKKVEWLGEAIGIMKNSQVLWYDRNPHAYPEGTTYFAKEV